MSFTSGDYLEQLCARAHQTLGVVHEEAVWDEAEETLILRTSQDVQPILDRNKELVALGGDGFFGPERNWRRIASIPEVLIVQWLQEEGLNIYRKEHWDYVVNKKLNDPAYAYLRTSPGRI